MKLTNRLGIILITANILLTLDRSTINEGFGYCHTTANKNIQGSFSEDFEEKKTVLCAKTVCQKVVKN